MRKSWLLALLALAGLSCDPGFEKESIVKDLRVLALQTEPPELVLPDLDHVIPEVAIEVLWADPADPRERPWTLSACAIGAKYRYVNGGEINQDRDRCETDRLALPLAAGSARPGDPIRALFRADAGILARAREADPLKGFDGQVTVVIEVAIGAVDDPLRAYAQKRVTYALPIPEGKLADENPHFARIEADGAPLADGATVAPLQKVKLDPKPADGAAQPYRVLTFTGGTRDLTESLRYAFFATAGKFSQEKTGGAQRLQLGQVAPDTFTEWTAPKEPGPVTLWFVIRDERGGASWLVRTIDVR
jgi:hypothetical protein